MLNNSHIYHQTKHDIAKRGIDGASTFIFVLSSYDLHLVVSNVQLNLPQMLKAKDDSVKGLTRGVEGLFKKNKVTYYKGHGSFISPTRLSVDLLSGETEEIEAKNVIIATGSDVAPFPGGAIQIDEEQIVSSTGALELKEVPGKMIVIGGGVIGLEMGSVWSRLGAEVTVVEFLGAIGGAGLDEEIGYVFSRYSEKSILRASQETVPENPLETRSQIQTEH